MHRPAASDSTDTSCLSRTHFGLHHRPPAHRQSDHLHRETAAHDTRSPDLPGPRTSLRSAEPATQKRTGCEQETFNPVLYRQSDHRRNRLALGPQRRAARPLSPSASPPRRRRSNRRSSPCRQASPSTPTPPTARPMCTDSPGQLRIRRARPNAPTSQDRHLLDRLPRPQRYASKAPSTSANRKPGDQYRLFMMASGFGINAKLIGSVKPNPETGQADRLLRKPAAGSLRRLPAAPLLRRTSPDGDPDHLHDLHTSTPSSTLGMTRPARTASRARSSASNPVPMAPNAPARSVPSIPASKRAPPPPLPAPSAPSP